MNNNADDDDGGTWEAAREQGMIVGPEQWDQLTGQNGIESMIKIVKSHKNQDEDHDYNSLKERVLKDLHEMKQRLLDIQKENLEGRYKEATIEVKDSSLSRLKESMSTWKDDST